MLGKFFVIFFTLCFSFYGNVHALKVAALVGDDIIFDNDIEKLVRINKLVLGEGELTKEQETMLFDRALKELIKESLLLQDLKFWGLEVSESNIEYMLISMGMDIFDIKEKPKTREEELELLNKIKNLPEINYDMLYQKIKTQIALELLVGEVHSRDLQVSELDISLGLEKLANVMGDKKLLYSIIYLDESEAADMHLYEYLNDFIFAGDVNVMGKLDKLEYIGFRIETKESFVSLVDEKQRKILLNMKKDSLSDVVELEGGRSAILIFHDLTENAIDYSLIPRNLAQEVETKFNYIYVNMANIKNEEVVSLKSTQMSRLNKQIKDCDNIDLEAIENLDFYSTGLRSMPVKNISPDMLSHITKLTESNPVGELFARGQNLGFVVLCERDYSAIPIKSLFSKDSTHRNIFQERYQLYSFHYLESLTGKYFLEKMPLNDTK